MDSDAEKIAYKEKMARRKAVQDAAVAARPIAEKGLLIVHTGPGKGKSTSGFGLLMRAMGHGWKVGVVQFIKGTGIPARSAPSRVSRICSSGGRWARGLPGRRRTGNATSPRRASVGRPRSN